MKILKSGQDQMDFASSTRTAENRTRRKEIVAKSSVVPNNLPKLRDRIDIEAH